MTDASRLKALRSNAFHVLEDAVADGDLSAARAALAATDDGAIEIAGMMGEIRELSDLDKAAISLADAMAGGRISIANARASVEMLRSAASMVAGARLEDLQLRIAEVEALSTAKSNGARIPSALLPRWAGFKAEAEAEEAEELAAEARFTRRLTED
jgi:hypothetical protein